MAFDTLSSHVGSNIPGGAGMIHRTDYPNLPLDLDVTGMTDAVCIL